MSRGMGMVQRRIVEAFDKHPERRFAIDELAAFAYPGQEIKRAQKESVRRALAKVSPIIGLHRCRIALSGVRGWRHIIGRART